MQTTFSPVEGQRRRYGDINQPIPPARKGEQQTNNTCLIGTPVLKKETNKQYRQTNKQTVSA